MTTITKAFHRKVKDAAFEFAQETGNSQKWIELTEGTVTVLITKAMARNGARGYYVPRISFRENGKVIAAADVQIV